MEIFPGSVRQLRSTARTHREQSRSTQQKPRPEPSASILAFRTSIKGVGDGKSFNVAADGSPTYAY